MNWLSYKPPGDDMDALPGIPLHLVKLADADEVCPVHNRKHGWYSCLPVKD